MTVQIQRGGLKGMTVYINVDGLPDLVGKLHLEGRCRARQLEENYSQEELAWALVEREEQFAALLERMRRDQ